jgi:cysteine desulfurase
VDRLNEERPRVSEVTYLDHAATTPLRPEVAHAMAEVHAGPLGNPTGSHPPAQRARRLLEEARDEVSDCLGFEPGEIVFTSGGTESANLAVFGSLSAARRAGATRPLLLYSAVEHPAVIESCRAAVAQGAEARPLRVDDAGRLDLDGLAAQLADRPLLVALMTANNETGVLEPVADAAALARECSPASGLFTDAVQAASLIDLSTWDAGADLVGVSAHKVGGPVGTGARAIRAAWPLDAHHHGGGQERERRSGTQDVAGAVGLALALRLAVAERAEQAVRLSDLRDRLAEGLLAKVGGAHRTVRAGADTLPGHLHLCFEGVDREELLVGLGREGVCVSGGSSCASGALEASYVLAAMGVPEAWAKGALRFSLGHGTTGDDIDRALSIVPEVVASLRRAV